MPETTGAAMRYERVTWFNTGTTVTPTWAMMGAGFNSLDDALNANVAETTYISDKSASKTVQSFAPEWSFDLDVIKDNTIHTKLRTMGESMATGANAEAEIVNMDIWKEDGAGYIPCYKQAVTVVMDSIAGGAGGEKLTSTGTLHGKGDPVAGFWDAQTDTFVVTKPVI